MSKIIAIAALLLLCLAFMPQDRDALQRQEITLGAPPNPEKSILFLVGADGTVGFLEGGQNSQKASILDGNNSRGWKEMADALEAEGYWLTEIPEGPGGIPVSLETIDLMQYKVIVFGSNNAIYTEAQVQAFSTYIQSGGSALFISDANFGEDWADASNSDQQFLSQFGWTMNQDNGTYAVEAGAFKEPLHPILTGITRFDGEGVTPITLSDRNVPGVISTIIAGVPAGKSFRKNNGNGANRNQGSVENATDDDATLIVAQVGPGRITGHFDRNTFFNKGGPGTDVTRFDNKAYAINLFNWLSANEFVDPTSTIAIEKNENTLSVYPNPAVSSAEFVIEHASWRNFSI